MRKGDLEITLPIVLLGINGRSEIYTQISQILEFILLPRVAVYGCAFCILYNFGEGPALNDTLHGKDIQA